MPKYKSLIYVTRFINVDDDADTFLSIDSTAAEAFDTAVGHRPQYKVEYHKIYQEVREVKLTRLIQTVEETV